MEIIITLLLLFIAAEVTYLVAVNTKKVITKKSGRPVFVDTSVLIDGRIIAVAQSGFMGSDTLYIPRSVIGELQYLADNADNEKRSRARHGLDVVTQLQAMLNVKVEIFQDGSKAEEGVDERLLKLAKQYSGAVCTIDYNLNKVAQVENIVVLNVNDLAMSLRMAYLPGEKILLELTQKGQDAHQAVGHLTDGTMVVVEHANKFINKTVEIEFIRSLQTAAGKMMFAKMVDLKKNDERSPIKKVQLNPVKKPIGRAAPVIEQPLTTTYHSDRNDQRIANAKRNPNNNNTQQKPRNNRQDDAKGVVNSQYQSSPRGNKPQAKRPRTSAQNEASLIEMLNNQE